MLRAIMISGVAVFLIVALAVMASGQVFFNYPTAWSAQLILLIESFATLSIAVTLVIAYLSGQPGDWMHTATTRNNKPLNGVEAAQEQDHAD
jgi:hypothetical protein